MRALVWLRSDLRTADNPALYHACREADRGVVAVFLVTRGQWQEHDWGAPKIDFVVRSVTALSDVLAEINVPLLVRQASRFEDAPAVLLGLATEHGCDALYYNEEYEVNERRRDEAVRRSFAEAGRGCRSFHDQTIIAPGTLRTTSGHFYTVFTPFRKAWTEHLRRAGLPEVLPLPRLQSEPVCAPDPPLAAVSELRSSASLAELWPAGEHESGGRLGRFTAGAISAYNERRDLPAEEATSRLSPYLAAGVISPRQCLVAAVEAGGNGLTAALPGPATWISEIVWREFYRHVLFGYPRVSMNRAFKLVTERVTWRDDEGALTAWQQGRTGVPIVDAGMRELAATGWMHNRVRMIVAQFLAKHLLLDWRLGERHFMRHLVDADLANNNGGWQWSASTGTDAAPYFRVFNPFLQGRRYDPEARYVRRWLPELAELSGEMIHDPEAFSGDERSARGYPDPIVDHRLARERAIAAFRQL